MERLAGSVRVFGSPTIRLPASQPASGSARQIIGEDAIRVEEAGKRIRRLIDNGHDGIGDGIDGFFDAVHDSAISGKRGAQLAADGRPKRGDDTKRIEGEADDICHEINSNRHARSSDIYRRVDCVYTRTPQTEDGSNSSTSNVVTPSYKIEAE